MVKISKARWRETSGSARETALRLYYRICEEGAYSNLLLKEELAGQEMDARDKRLISALVYGALSERAFLDYEIQEVSSLPIARTDRAILALLRLALYELYFMRSKDHAVLFEYAGLCRRIKLSSATSFVNALLRRLLREREERRKASRILTLPPDIRLSVHPSLLRDLIDSLGEEKAYAFLESSKKARPLTFRFRGTEAEKTRFLEKHSSLFEAGLLSPLCLRARVPFEEIKDFLEDGILVIQGEAASLPPLLLDLSPDDLVADFCAAPGNKSLEIQDIRAHRGSLFAYDLHPKRLALIEARFSVALRGEKRRGEEAPPFSAPILESRDMRRPFTAPRFDKVLLDVPCSGYGLLSSKPELRYRYDSEALQSLVDLQATLLDAAAASLKEGGLLVYSTCTLRREENEGQSEAFLRKHPCFELAPFEDPRCGHEGRLNFLRAEASAGESEGFYMTRFRKKRPV